MYVLILISSKYYLRDTFLFTRDYYLPYAILRALLHRKWTILYLCDRLKYD